MTTTTHPGAARAATARSVGGAVTQRRVIAAEWLKFRSQRSTWWILSAGVLSIVAAGVSPALAYLLAADAPGDAGADPTGGALSGVSFTQLVVGALGVVVVSSEYATGLVRATFTAVPARLPVLWAKALVVAAATAAVTLAAVLIAFLTTQAVLSATDTSISLRTPGALRAVVGASLSLAVTAVLGTGFGWLIRNAVGALAAVFGVLFVLPVVGLAVPPVTPYLPGNAGAAIMQTGPATGLLPPWLGLGLFAAYAVAALAAGALRVRLRDA